MPAKKPFDPSVPVEPDLPDETVAQVLDEAAEELNKPPKPSPPSPGAVLDMRALRNEIGSRLQTALLDMMRDFGLQYSVANSQKEPWTFIVKIEPPPGGDW